VVDWFEISRSAHFIMNDLRYMIHAVLVLSFGIHAEKPSTFQRNETAAEGSLGFHAAIL
jgi:hypothetical protein